MSRNISGVVKALFDVCTVSPTDEENELSVEIESCYKTATIEAITGYGDEIGVISPDMIRASGRGDAAYSMLSKQITNGFPHHRHLMDPLIREFWEVRHRLSTDNGLIMLDRRIVIPVSYRKRVLRCLHSAHQGVAGMKARANETVYWPGMDSCIRNHRESCSTCIRIAPSQPREPIVLTESPEWPFQKIALDLFYVNGQAYLVCADRFTGWLMIYHLPPGHTTATHLIDITRDIFQTYGVPEEMSRDGGPPMHSQIFLDFLSRWKVDHRLSSVGYAQSNGRAELAVKTAKRIVLDNVAPSGSLDTDKIARAVLQYRNTPIQGLGLSPAQLLLHRQLRDCIPAHPSLYKPHKEWVTASYQREAMLSKRNTKLQLEYDRHTHNLRQLQLGDRVVLQDLKSKRWTRSGVVVEILPHRQYHIRMDGSGRVTLRNRRFLKRVTKGSPQIIPSAVLLNPDAKSYTPLHQSVSSDLQGTYIPPTQAEAPVTPVQKVPRSLSRLQNYNNPGRKESTNVGLSRLRNSD